MKKLFAILLVLMMLAAIPALAENDNTLRVTGSATLSLAADRATLYIGANVSGVSVEEAQQKSEAIMDQVLKAIEKAGIPKGDIVTNQYDVSVSNDGYEHLSGDGSKTIYRVNSMLFVTVRQLDLLAKVVGEATKAGANSIYGLEFSSSKGEEAYDRVMTLAVEKAKKNAETLATATGKKLGTIIRVEDGGVYRGQFAASNSMDMLSAKGVGAAIVTGDVSLSATVTLEYELAKAPLMP